MIQLNYTFWLFAVSLTCLAAEHFFPWRKNQRLLRPQFAQDLFWLLFNGVLWAMLVRAVFQAIPFPAAPSLGAAVDRAVGARALLGALPFGLQVAVYLVVADFIEWLVHNALHRVGWLWRFHRVHHSITTMDWIGNFRFHWAEHIIYKTIKFLPLVTLFGHNTYAMLAAWVIATAIGHLNHSNLNISYGPLRYLLNSPRMHIWHHEKDLRRKAGVNFGIVLSLWDWVFGTVYMPREEAQPGALGYHGQERNPAGLAMRFFLPFIDRPAPLR